MKLKALAKPKSLIPVLALLVSSAWLLMTVGDHHKVSAELDKARFALQNSSNGLRELQDRPSQPMIRQEAWELLQSQEVSAQLLRIETLANQADLDLVGMHAPSATNSGRQRYKLSAKGSADQVCAFLVSVESERQLLLVHEFELTPARDGRVKMDITLASYHKIGREGG
ncbi:MAG: hypothetical protein ACYTG5_04990 [Planctomycetota bacterium]|jgi:hypothetical protein